MLSVAFQVVLDCPHCSEHIPLNAMVPGIHCPQCRRPLALGPDIWTRVVGQAIDAASRLREGEPDAVIETTPAGDINLIFKRSKPQCGICDLDVNVESAWQQARVTNGWTQCPRCQSCLAMRPPPAAIRPSLVALFGEQFATTADPDPSKSMQPISFSCQQCGAVLPVDGTSRMVSCQYCRATACLPDALWKTVHPKGKASYWYALCTH